MVREYVGARYVPVFVGEWDSSMQTTYEPLSIVTVANVGSYTSKKFVPVGIPITDTDYWALSGSVSGQIISLTDRVDALEATIKTPEQFGAVGDGVADDTAAINSALSGGGIIVFKAGASYKVDPDVSLLVDDNSYVDLNGATIVSKAVSSDYYEVFYINQKSNVTIKNGAIIGDRDIHTGATGEWGMCVYVGGSTNVLIDNIDISKAWGDGVYIGDTAEYDNVSCSSVTVTNCKIHDCRRQGISVTFADDVIIDGNIIYNISGTAPEACIDIEPNSTQHANNVIISNNILKVAKKGIETRDANGDIDHISIHGNTLEGNNATGVLMSINNSHASIFDNIFTGDISTNAVSILGSDSVFENNKFIDLVCTIALYLYDATRIAIKGNTFKKLTLTGSCVYFYHTSFCSLIGNIFASITTSSSDDYLIYLNGASGANADYNTINNNTADNIVFKYGICFGQYANHNVMAHNYIRGVYDYTLYTRLGNSIDNNAYFNELYQNANNISGGYGGSFVGSLIENIQNGVLVP